MSALLGQKLLENRAVNEIQLQEALERQRLQGGRLGHNLVALGHITSEKLGTFFNSAPPAPRTVSDTGLDFSFLTDLVLKHLLHMGEFRLSAVAESTRLPAPIIDSSIELLRREKMVEVRGAAEYVKSSFKFSITEQGKNRAGELLEICRYAGPAPVTLAQYRNMVELQTIRNIVVSEEQVQQAFSHLVLGESLLKRLGPALSSGRPMFIYGPPGNGKTAIAETIGTVLPDEVFIPFAVTIGGQIITVFDPVTHIAVPMEGSYGDLDQRWVRVRRPVVMTGGEFNLKMLDLEFNSISKFYEAPLQMKANNGLFIVDDFGRQQMNPQGLLNRWIVTLDRGVDFLSMHTGMKFDIPFDQLVIFSTNLEPARLVDEAFLRRIRYKIRVEHPNEREFEEIFRKVCVDTKISFDADVFAYLLKHYYHRLGVKFNACHPRDILDHIIDRSRYYLHPPDLTREAVDSAWEDYFVE
ncbi:MAG: ATPase [Desulfuromonadales bacterium]